MGDLNGCTESKKKLSSMVVLSQICLHDWWLVKADPDSHGKRLGIGGFSLKINLGGIRSFSSASIVKRFDVVTLHTVDNVTIMVQGYLNKSRTLENGFSEEVCDNFLIGFPYNWEDFAGEEPDSFHASKEVPHSDAYKTPIQEARGNIFEASSGIQSMDYDHRTKKKRRTSSNLAVVGPITRSRARFLKSGNNDYESNAICKKESKWILGINPM